MSQKDLGHTHEDIFHHPGCPACEANDTGADFVNHVIDMEARAEPPYDEAGNRIRETVRWADEAMYHAEPMTKDGDLVKPRVTLLYMTPNPLRVMAAAAELYNGYVVHTTHQVSRSIAMEVFKDMAATKLQAPLEFIDLHFLIEGVTRAFTHQLVRQRTAVYVQESMRFAVKDNVHLEVATPPSIACLATDNPKRVIWDNAVAKAAWSYKALIDAGVPAEDARGLLPTNITTRVHYKTNLRNLAEHSEVRLCSQAQYEWKEVWLEIIKAIADYGPIQDRWQMHMINTLFRPICYRTGKCEFMSSSDRYCAIRERVEAHHKKGEPSEEWRDIISAEALMPNSARKSNRG